VVAKNTHNRFYPVAVASIVRAFADANAFADTIAACSWNVQRLPHAAIANGSFRNPWHLDATIAQVQHTKPDATAATTAYR